jgi:8-oxo-dGTP pyrophosphatase MutT (NUDIX family)
MSFPTRNSVKVLLLNDKNELLLMCAEDPATTTVGGEYHGRFWFPIGGEVESGESIQEAALREIYEETGIKEEEVELGPIVWYGEFDLVLGGTLTHLKQIFIVAKTKKTNIALSKPTEWEKTVVKKIAWFSYEEIKNSDEVIYPVLLSEYLPDILLGKYPKKPLEIDLAKVPRKKNS